MKTRIEGACSAVIFDLDGTLYDSRFLPLALGFSSLFDFRRLAAVNAARKTKAGLDFGSRDSLIDAMILDASLRLPGEDPEALRAWYEETLYGRFVELLRRFFSPRRCIVRFLLERKIAGCYLPPLGVLSDYGHVDDRLHAIGLNPFDFDIRVSSEDEGALKPSPRPFLEAARRLGADPGRVLVVGDTRPTDGAGALAAGMEYLHLPQDLPADFCERLNRRIRAARAC
ncbi:MAG: hypothetical protein A2Z99_16265 [Treponema sp. GWB1_62_6]|nr:MAG: hypothetical protein A2Y36_06595 [Treponema sp. GWA1_62_8]OHE65349.1 MAG: hypothetical protein A2001_05150 [Treponema sp. GWC1_61_84]OHE65355.1 MAG: hypothetical protein A2Z99_16265 [Treponema sp. GWB1_62_6]HCM26663.1 hypothetical protein [Treponema sp.]